MNRTAAALVALGAFVGCVSGARAEQAGQTQDFIKALLGHAPGPGKAAACFSRVYDAKHLSEHPKQNVRTMSAMVLLDSADGGTYQLTIGTSFRKRPHLFMLAGDCGNFDNLDPVTGSKGAATAHCSIACDGGNINVALKGNGSILVTIPGGARVWRPGTIDPNDDVEGAFGSDDKLFRLDRTDPSQCLPLTSDKDERNALLGRAK